MKEMSLCEFVTYCVSIILIIVGGTIAYVTVKKAFALEEYATIMCYPYAIHHYFLKNDFLYTVCRNQNDELIVKTTKNPFQ